MRIPPFSPTCNPIDPGGTAKLLTELNTWLEHGGDVSDALAILDKMGAAAGKAFTAELMVHLVGVGLNVVSKVMAAETAALAAKAAGRPHRLRVVA